MFQRTKHNHRVLVLALFALVSFTLLMLFISNDISAENQFFRRARHSDFSLDRIVQRHNENNAQKPAFLMSHGRQNVSIVLGVRVVNEYKNILLGTLSNLIRNMNKDEQSQTLIIVFVAEEDPYFVMWIGRQIDAHFGPLLVNGLIEVMAPPSWYYLHMNLLKPKMVKLELDEWYSKQKLDYAFLMAYAQSKGKFYVQLEGDIMTQRGFVATMKRFADEQTILNSEWFVLDFGHHELEFIGKMFRSSDLPWMITFFQTVYNAKPDDSLLENLVYNYNRDEKFNDLDKSQMWLQSKSSLFYRQTY